MFAEGGQGGVEIRVGLTHLGDTVHRVHGRRMVFREDLSDLWKTQFQNVPDEVHGDLARQSDGTPVGAALEIGHPDAVVL